MIYSGLLFHSLVPEKIAMAISCHKARAVFDRYNIISENDLANAGRQLEAHFENFGDKTGTECTEMQQPSSSTHRQVSHSGIV